MAISDIYDSKHSFKIHKNDHVDENANVTLVNKNRRKRLVLGNNTGGFTQSPIIANSILELIQNKHTSMATLYHPNRKIKK